MGKPADPPPPADGNEVARSTATGAAEDEAGAATGEDPEAGPPPPAGDNTAAGDTAAGDDTGSPPTTGDAVTGGLG